VNIEGLRAEAAALRMEMEGLRAEAAQLRDELALGGAAAYIPPRPASGGPDAAGVVEPAPTPGGRPAHRGPSPPAYRSYVRFDSPAPAVTIGYDPSGSLAVVNDDPELTGQKVTVRAYAADGTLDDIDVVIPAPRP